jgi:hypothetical protein
MYEKAIERTRRVEIRASNGFQVPSDGVGIEMRESDVEQEHVESCSPEERTLAGWHR